MVHATSASSWGITPARRTIQRRWRNDNHGSNEIHTSAASRWCRPAASRRRPKATGRPRSRWRIGHLWIGVPKTVCAAGTGVSAFSNPPIVTGVLAVVVAVGSGLDTFLNPNERHRRHRDAGNAYRALNNHAQIFRTTECVAVTDPSVLRAKLQELDQRRNDLNQGSPIISRPAFEAARRGIEAGDPKHRVDQSS